jgi:hypothetical protein
MDRLFDLQAVDWQTLPVSTLNQWEHEAALHSRACRCEKCALYFARITPEALRVSCDCPIALEIIQKLRAILARLNKL